MADVECTAVVSADELRAAAESVREGYELALELDSLLSDLMRLESVPPLVYSLQAMAERAARRIDRAHTEVNGILYRVGLPLVAPEAS